MTTIQIAKEYSICENDKQVITGIKLRALTLRRNSQKIDIISIGLDQHRS
jgi:hypothetical protein